MSVRSTTTDAPISGGGPGDTPPITSSREEKLYAKVFWRIMPLLMLSYVVAYLDRVNVGFAKLQMAQQLNLSDAAYGAGAGIFFIGYFLFEVPSNLFLHRVGARLWIARIMITWGLVSGAFAFASSEAAFYGLRFLLGVAEAGFFPGIILYTTYWFPASRRAKIITIFMSAIPVASIFGNPLSGFLMDAFNDKAGWSGWRWMFMIEAIPAIVLGIVILFALGDSIRGAKWLDDSEKAILEKNIVEDNRTKVTSSHSIPAMLRNGWIWLMCLIYFSVVLGQYGLTFWMPTLVKAAGIVGNFNIGLVSAIPYVCTFVAMLALGRSSDRLRERRWHLAIPALVGALGLVGATIAPSAVLAIASLSIAAAGVISCAPLFWSLPTATLTGIGAAAGIAWINSVGNLAGYMGPTIVGFLKQSTGNNSAGMYVLAGAQVVAAIAVLSISAKKVNR